MDIESIHIDEDVRSADVGYRAAVKPRFRTFLFCSVGLIVLIAAARTWVCWTNDRYLDHTAGAWIALAADLKRGVFYRPLFSSIGYGGTRYFPLYFVLYAMLLKIGLPVLLSGYLISALAMALLVAGIFCVLSNLGVEPWLAACVAGASLASYSAQLSLLTTRADGLACALNIWGIGIVAGPKRTHTRILLAGMLFTLAWSTKVTTVFGFLATFIWLLMTGSGRVAWQLAAKTAFGYLAVGAAILAGSHGRIIEIFKACASGGAGLLPIVAGPWHMLSVAVREDAGFLLFLLLALLALFAKPLRNLPALFFILTVTFTALIFGSPGANFNHLLDVQVAAVILFASWISNKNSPMPKELGILGVALASVLAAVPLLHKLRIEDRMVPSHRFERAITFIGETSKPILAENPALPVLAGQSPYVMDPFMLRLLREHVPALREPLLDALRDHAFGAVVLFMRDPRTEEGRRWYEEEHFGPGFVSTLNANYQLAWVLNEQFIFLPRTEMKESRCCKPTAFRSAMTALRVPHFRTRRHDDPQKGGRA